MKKKKMINKMKMKIKKKIKINNKINSKNKIIKIINSNESQIPLFFKFIYF